MTPIKTLTLTAALVASVFSGSLCAAEPLSLDTIVAVVNSQPITERELEQRVHTVATNLRRQNQELPPMGALRAQVLDRLITEIAIVQQAQEAGIQVDDQVLNATIDQIAQANHMTASEFRQNLLNDGISLAQFRHDLRNEILTQRLRERDVDSRIVIPESEVDAFLSQEAGFGGQDPTEYHLQRIVLPIDKPQDANQVEQLARRLADEAKTTDFGALVAANSKDDKAFSGGDMDWLRSTRLPGEYYAAIKKNPKKGAIYVVRIGQAWHVVKLADKRDGVQFKLGNTPMTRTHVRHILMVPNELIPEQDVLRRLGELRERIQKGELDFATAARLNSVDGSATRGGDLGWVEPGNMAPEFERAMNELKPGEISNIVRTPFGYHLILVDERQQENSANPERLRAQARYAIREQKLNEAAFDWERRMRDNAYVDIRQDVTQVPNAQ